MDIRKLFQWARVGLTAGIPILHYNNKYFKKFAKNPEKYSFEFRYDTAKKAISKVLKAFRLEYYVEGYDKFLSLGQKCLITPNHLSDADPLILAYLSEKPFTFVTKVENMDMFCIGNVLRGIEAIPLDRDNVMKQISQIKCIVSNIKDEKRPDVCIYPEGTRNRKPADHCLEFHAGTFKMAYMSKAPIVPVAVYGTFRILQKNVWLKRYPIFVKYLDPIYPEEYEKLTTVELASKIQNMINGEVDRMRKLDYEAVKKQKLSRKRFLKETAVDGIKS